MLSLEGSGVVECGVGLSATQGVVEDNGAGATEACCGVVMPGVFSILSPHWASLD